MNEFVRLSHELFLICVYIHLNTTDDVNVSNVKRHNEKPRD